jgi:hypothetical protein
LVAASNGRRSPSSGRSVKLLLVFASTVILGLNLLEIHDQGFYSLLDTYVFRNGASSSTKAGSVFLCRRYVRCTVVSARVYPRCHGVKISMDSVPSSGFRTPRYISPAGTVQKTSLPILHVLSLSGKRVHRAVP